jgi:hypothetical protein
MVVGLRAWSPHPSAVLTVTVPDATKSGGRLRSLKGDLCHLQRQTVGVESAEYAYATRAGTPWRAARSGSSREDLVRIRRRGLIEFEMDRDPEATNQTVARACGTSPSTVADVREVTSADPSGVDLTRRAEQPTQSPQRDPGDRARR